MSNSIYVVYCDGACVPNPGEAGWGAVVISPITDIPSLHSGKLGYGTNQTAELMAAIEGLKRTPAGATVELVSDSQYVLKGISEWRRGWEARCWKTYDKKPVANRELWILLFAEVDKRKVSTRWVKGHNGDRFNEMCDQLAMEAIGGTPAPEAVPEWQERFLHQLAREARLPFDQRMARNLRQEGVTEGQWVQAIKEGKFKDIPDDMLVKITYALRMQMLNEQKLKGVVIR